MNATDQAIDRLIRTFGAVLLDEDLDDRGLALREEIEEPTEFDRDVVGDDGRELWLRTG